MPIQGQEYIWFQKVAARKVRARHEDKHMFNNNKKFANWFPGQTATRDRWGDPVGGEVTGREFKSGTNAPEAAAQRMRWSLGHA